MISLMLLGLAASAGPLTLEYALSVPYIGNLTAAPAMGRFAFTVRVPRGRAIFLADAENPKARAVVLPKSDDGFDLSELTFSPNAKMLAYTRGTGENPTSDPRGARAEIWVAALDFQPGEVHKVADGTSPIFSYDGKSIWYLDGGKIKNTSLDGTKTTAMQIRGEVKELRRAPNGSRLVFTVSRGDHALIGALDPESQLVTWIAPSIDRDSSPVFARDGSHVAFIRLPGGSGKYSDTPQRFELHTGDLAIGEDDLVFAPPDASGPYAQTTPERPLLFGTQNFLVFAWETDGWLRLYAIDSEADAPKPIPLSPEGCEAEGAILSPDRFRVYFTANCGDRERRDLFVAEVDGASPARALTSGPMLEHSPAPLSDNKHLVFIRAGARQPPLPYIMDETGKTIPVVLDVQRDLDPSMFVDPELVTIKGKLHGELFLPPGAAAKGEKRAAVIFAHGGPRRQMLPGWHPLEYYHFTYAMNQALAASGFVVLSINFRGGSGYGAAYRKAPGFGIDGGSELEDFTDAAAMLAKRPDVDPNRIGVYGGSYGGYLTGLALAKRSNVFKSGVAISGFYDWTKKRELDGEAKRRALDASPIAQVATWRSPVLFIHGEDDRTVPFSQTVELAQKLRALGKVPVETLVLPDEGHMPLVHANLVKTGRATIDFFQRSLAKR